MKADLISRQAAIDAIKKNAFRLTFAEEQNCEGHVAWSAEAVYSDVMEGALLELPSAQPEQRWIPCSERLPEEMGTYMTTIDYGEHGLVTGQRYYYGRGLKWNDECVIAWMPLPTPYKAEMESEECVCNGCYYNDGEVHAQCVVCAKAEKMRLTQSIGG